MEKQSPAILRFGVFEVDVRAGELRKQGVRIKLQEQPFQILCTLLEHRGELVTREELRNRLWPADTRRLRSQPECCHQETCDALGESADAPVFIETMARRGYCFIAPLETGRFNGTNLSTDAKARNIPACWAVMGGGLESMASAGAAVLRWP
jgi:DNA-binding winged helix-turn-helix (wHTH) protein